MLKVPVSADDHVQGSLDSPLVLVEYGDYECPHCGRAHPIVKRLQKQFGKRLAFVFRNFPLREIHPVAEPAAETAEFAATHQRFWEAHDGIFENQESLSAEFLLELAGSLQLSAEDLAAALEGGTFASRVKKDFVGGVRSGVNGTPTFFINGQRHDASFDYETLAAALQAIV